MDFSERPLSPMLLSMSGTEIVAVERQKKKLYTERDSVRGTCHDKISACTFTD